MLNPTLFLALAAALLPTSSATPITTTTTRQHIKRQDTPCKRGLAFAKNAESKVDLFDNGPSCWGYDWEARVNDKGAYSLPSHEYVPMLHDTSAMFTNAWPADVEKAIAAGSTHVLSFNEPDQDGGGGTNISLSDAIRVHNDLIQKPYSGRVKIGSPAVTNSQNATQGIDYLTQFLAGCHNCQIDFVCAHWYAPGATLADFQSHVSAVHNATGKPVWVTEWRAPDDASAAQFVADATSWLDTTAFVERYAYYSVEASMTNGAALTTLGSKYASA